VIQDPCNIRGDIAVNSGHRGAAAELRAERDDTDQVISRRYSVLALHFHQRSAAVAAARVLAQDTAHAQLLVAYGRVASKGLRTPVSIDNRQLHRLQNYARLGIVCEQRDNL